MCTRSQQLCGHASFELCDGISSKNEKVRKTFFVRSNGAQVESLKQKNGQKSRDTVPLMDANCQAFRDKVRPISTEGKK